MGERQSYGIQEFFVLNYEIAPNTGIASDT